MNRIKPVMRDLLLLLSGLSLVACSYGELSDKEKIITKQVTSKKPNIVFIFTDDQRYGTIGALKQDQVITPNIDKLVNNGVNFNNAYIMGLLMGQCVRQVVPC